MEISGQGLREFMIWVRNPLGLTTAPRMAWMVIKRLPGLKVLARTLGVLRPVVNIGLAMADIWLAIDEWIQVRRNPDLEQIFSAAASTVLASCSVITAMNIPLLSRLSAVLTILVDFLKHSLINMAESEPLSLPLIVNPTSGGRLELTPAMAI